MARYAAHDKNRNESVAINLETNDGVQVIHLSPESPTATRSFQLGPNMKLSVGSDHSAYVRARVASKPPVAPIQPVAKNGLSIDRIHQLVNPDGSTTPLTEPKPGDLIRVTLRVTHPKDDTRYRVQKYHLSVNGLGPWLEVFPELQRDVAAKALDRFLDDALFLSPHR